jgi:dUTP pyrophosphatase
LLVNMPFSTVNTPVPVAIKQLPGSSDLPLPAYETAEAAGMDLRAAVTAPVTIAPHQWDAIPTGIAIALPSGYEAQIRPRSGLARKFGISMVNSPGTIDADYRGEIMVLLINHGTEPFVVERGDRIAQMVIAPVSRAEWVITEDLESTDRGSGGFGHTGKK